MTDTPASMTYGGYLALDELLSAQKPLSEHHDEMLFVVIHQTKELWLKQIIHELTLARELIRRDALVPVHKALSRVSRIQAVMTLTWDVLATMTPADYTSFRDVLGSSSGFQSAQFRQMEYMLGIKDGTHLRHQDEQSQWYGAMERSLREPSLWDEANAALARAGFDLPADVLERDWSEAYQPSEAVEAAWAEVYRDTARWWPLYQLAEKLVDIDDAMATWRHKHVVTVERIIGMKMGTGGTSGVAYLQSTVGKRAFPELWSLRTKL
jgi:tryptophan 2,3-dioxygenase